MELYLPIDTQTQDITTSTGGTITGELYSFADDYSFWCLNSIMMHGVSIDGIHVDDLTTQEQKTSALGQFTGVLYSHMIDQGWDASDALLEIASAYPALQ